jgi:pimeloyl-ACP methyl ester carboxylesterase
MAIAYTRAGSGEPLILLHGLGGSRRIWGPLIDRLAAEREVIAIDLPGFGESPVLPADVTPTPANLGVPVAELCAELGLARPHLAGNSLGGWVALELSKSGNAESVCAISPAGLWRRPLGPRSFDSRAWAHRLRPLIGLLMRSAGARVRFLRTIVADPQRLSEGEAKALVHDWLDAPGYDAANHEMRSHVFEHPERVGVPTTIAWGTEDRLVAPPRPERIPPGARYIELEGVGHTPTWDDPELIAALLLESSGGEWAASAQAGSGRSSPGQAPVAL